MTGFLRLLRVVLTARRRGALGPLAESVLSFRVMPSDLDVNLHMNNGRYLSFMDLGRLHLVAQVGASHVVLGTDYPYPWEDKAVDHIMNTPGLTDEERVAILGGTAAKLLNIK